MFAIRSPAVMFYVISFIKCTQRTKKSLLQLCDKQQAAVGSFNKLSAYVHKAATIAQLALFAWP